MRRAEEQPRLTKELAETIIPSIRHIARRKGYAIAVHGSLSYDIDLVAAPWTESAESAEELIDGIKKVVEAVCGYVCIAPGNPEKKPHGRLAWSIHTFGQAYFDVSVMPRIPKEVTP